VRALRTIEGVEVRGKRVLVRIDADVDLDENGNIEPGGDHRLLGCLPTIQYLRERGARIILLSHLGRPEGNVVDTLRMARIGDLLSQHVPGNVLPVTVGPEAREAGNSLEDGDVLLLENVRFDPKEERNDPGFAGELASLGELYVNEAFAVSHRTHASLVAITAFLPSYAGLLFAKEVRALEQILEHPEPPVVAVISGAKLETKVALLRNLLPKVEVLLTGGGIANMFLKTRGFSVGVSLIEPYMEQEVRALSQAFKKKIVVPLDARVARKDHAVTSLIVAVDAVESAASIYDIGPQTVQRYCSIVSGANTCVWNGPLGKVELPEFQEGTRAFAKCLQASRAYSVVGGGDTVTALRQMRLTEGFGHVSSGGGAMIAFLEGASLPAVEALRA
jgi:phosphoglycerate kinase